jgi:hypothetical protein
MRSTHLPARFRAFPAGFGALLAMIHRVFSALLAARVTDFCAQRANAFREFGAARHLAHRQRTDIRATAVELDAARHHLHFLFVQAGGRAVFARLHALVTGFNTGFIVFVRHDYSFGWMPIHIGCI